MNTNVSTARYIGSLVEKTISPGNGVVYGVFSASVAFLFGDYIVSLYESGPDSPMGICASPLPRELFRTCLGLPVNYQNRILTIGDGVWSINLQQTELYPNQHICPIYGDKEKLKEARNSIYQILAEEPRKIGFYLLKDRLLQNESNMSMSEENGIMIAAVKPIMILHQGFLERNIGLCCTSIKGLLGLGPGLTPSGDDFLAGLFLTLKSFCLPKASAEFRDNLLERLCRIPAGLTSPYGWSIITASLEGCSSSVAIQALSGLFSGAFSLINAKKLAKIGGSSGIDMLIGFSQAISLGLCLL